MPRPICQRHGVQLRLKSGVWTCPYSHRERRDRYADLPRLCSRCGRNPAGSEGLCYTCRYYRAG